MLTLRGKVADADPEGLARPFCCAAVVQGKLRRSFKEQGRVLSGKIKGDKKMDKRQKQRRRRT
jgi:hypothetical protein